MVEGAGIEFGGARRRPSSNKVDAEPKIQDEEVDCRLVVVAGMDGWGSQSHSAAGRIRSDTRASIHHLCCLSLSVFVWAVGGGYER